MTLRPCIECGTLTERSHCPEHRRVERRQRKTPGRSSRAQNRFREAVLRNAGHRCEAIENGVRCEATDGLEAHHLQPVRDSRSFSPEAGVCLCRRHHHQAERDAAA